MIPISFLEFEATECLLVTVQPLWEKIFLVVIVAGFYFTTRLYLFLRMRSLRRFLGTVYTVTKYAYRFHRNRIPPSSSHPGRLSERSTVGIIAFYTLRNHASLRASLFTVS
ncbi:hypothetical protein JAAARDRAFT_415411 [Jaapia argillacea MUCL 33604]|uniref:Uncharacterized protein n=1 Tax=Jaapia argillacea MUCL 33604 TaxID=933084 RepID=A0A067PG40_9AGAM|nr:hypothetical protein JAAARDRAFT_415411 [Jaapia argillacea MUCL 33604]